MGPERQEFDGFTCQLRPLKDLRIGTRAAKGSTRREVVMTRRLIRKTARFALFGLLGLTMGTHR